jgi:hypothetical protein
MRRALPAACLGIALFVAACALPRIGMFNRQAGSDIPIYKYAGEHLLSGEIPYRDFYLDYPPGALPVYVVPALGPDDEFVAWFKAVEVAVGCVGIALVALVLARLGASTRRLYVGTAFAGAAPLVLGPTVLNRYDLWPATLLVAAVACLVWGRSRSGLGFLGASVAAKGFAIVAAPPAIAYVWLRRGRREAVIAALVGVAVLALFVLPFLALGPGGVRFTFQQQVRRPLQVESLGAALLLSAHRLDLYDARVVSTYGSQNLAGGTASAVATTIGLLGVAALVGLWLLSARGEQSQERLVAAIAASVAIFVAFDKVLSPQFLIWLIPLVALVGGRAGVTAGGLLLAALGLTRSWFPGHGYNDLVHLGDYAWVVLARDLVLLGLAAVLAAAVARPWLVTECYESRALRSEAT